MPHQLQDRHELTVEELIKHLQNECIVAPINYRKIVKAYKDDAYLMHQALTFLHQGLLDNYHMIPGNGRMSF